MKNKKIEALLLLISGFAFIISALFIYFYIDKTFPDSDSSRVQHLNWWLNIFGKTGTAGLVALVGLATLYFGVRNLRNK